MRTAIIDLDSVVFSCLLGNKVLDSSGIPKKKEGRFVYVDKTPREMIDAADYWMNTIVNQSGADGYIAYIKGHGNFRYEIKSDYKSNRPTTSPVGWKLLKAYFIDEWKAIEVNDIEVDDAVNIARLTIPNSFVCAIDRDLLGLEGTHYNWRKNEWVTTSKDEALIKFWTDMIAGQSGDGIKGIPGKGEKFAEKLFTNVESGYAKLVFEAYINCFPTEAEAIKEYYQNYNVLKMLSVEYPIFIPAEPFTLKKPAEIPLTV